MMTAHWVYKVPCSETSTWNEWSHPFHNNLVRQIILSFHFTGEKTEAQKSELRPPDNVPTILDPLTQRESIPSELQGSPSHPGSPWHISLRDDLHRTNICLLLQYFSLLVLEPQCWAKIGPITWAKFSLKCVCVWGPNDYFQSWFLLIWFGLCTIN
jgi:hypothetical protein